MRINHNIAALNTYNKLSANTAATSASLEKLSSGLKINKAADNAAGLAISEKMRGQIRGLDQASTNASDGISLINTAEGALSETTSILQRMRELAVQSANDTNTSSDRGEMQKELNQLTAEISRISNTTEFNTMKLLDGSFTGSGSAATQETLTIDLTSIGDAYAGADIVLSIGGETYTIGLDQAAAAANADTVTAGTNTVTVGVLTSAAVGTDIAAALNQLKGVESNSLQHFTITGTADSLVISATANGIYDGDAGEDTLSLTSGLAANLAVLTSGADGVGGEGVLQIGANADQQLAVAISDMRGLALGVSDTTGGGDFMAAIAANALSDDSGATEYALNISTAAGATASLGVIDTALNSVNAERSKLGAIQNRLTHSINNLSTASENLSAAESRIRDVDMAEEMVEFTKNNILSQAAQSMLAQANQQPQNVLQLLQ